jgi:hypothetical protein
MFPCSCIIPPRAPLCSFKDPARLSVLNELDGGGGGDKRKSGTRASVRGG